ncbi:MAG: sodium:calcium antiporter [Candidatus Nealsonbacteria bacterium]
MISQIAILLGSFILLALAAKWLIDALSRIGIYLKLKEFVLAFFVIGIGATIPNLIIGIVSAVNKIPELSFGDVVGANILDLSIVVGLAALLSRGGLSADSRTVQGSSVFIMVFALLPLFLIFDGTLSRMDGIILLLGFAVYTVWLFSKKDRFTKVYENHQRKFTSREIIKDVSFILVGLVLLFIGGQGVVQSAMFFYETFNLPLGMIGIFVVAVGTCMPEIFFSLQAARKGQDWMILGNLMGNVATTATFVLGIVALITPIKIVDFSPFVIARIFLVIAVLSFFLLTKTGRKITKKEGLVLIGIYVAFLITEILTK